MRFGHQQEPGRTSPRRAALAMDQLTMEQQMSEPITAKKSIAAEEQDASDEKTYKVWIEIEGHWLPTERKFCRVAVVC